MPPLGKGSVLKGMNLVPQGANSFFLERNPFLKELSVQESEQEVSKVLSSENGKQSTWRANRSFKSSLPREWQTVYQESKQEVTKVVCSQRMASNLPGEQTGSHKSCILTEWQAIYQESKQEVTKVVSPHRMASNLPGEQTRTHKSCLSPENGEQSTSRANRKSQKLSLLREWQTVYQESKQEVTKVVSPQRMANNLPGEQTVVSPQRMANSLCQVYPVHFNAVCWP